jgi:hypothetical protein
MTVPDGTDYVVAYSKNCPLASKLMDTRSTPLRKVKSSLRTSPVTGARTKTDQNQALWWVAQS